MRKVNFSDIKEAGSFSRPEEGAYICKITGVKNNDSESYLEIEYDIDEGEFKGYYTDFRSKFGWGGTYRKYYTEKAAAFWNRFCHRVSKSNGNFVFDGNEVNSDEQTLVGKRIGLVFQRELYTGNDGSDKTRFNVWSEFAVDDLDKQKIPQVKDSRRANVSSDGFKAVNVDDGIDEELPFK